MEGVMPRLFPCFVAVLTVATATTLTGDDSDLPQPLELTESLERFELADGYKIEQVAVEPMVFDPVAICFDEDANLYVAEMRGYPHLGDKRLGTVRLLRDADGDGDFDQVHVFADGLNWPTALAPYKGGIFVATSGEIHYLKDTDADGHADIRRTVYKGLEGKDPQRLVRGLRWGFDGRIHGTGHDRIQSALDEKAPAVNLSESDFSLNPRTLGYAPTAGNGVTGLSFDAWGNKFVGSDSVPLQQVMVARHYLSRNPYILAKKYTAPLTETASLPALKSSTGLSVIAGQRVPGIRQQLSIAEPAENQVMTAEFNTNALPYSVKSVTKLVESSDPWFRPVDIVSGPDGSLYLVDMYRPIIDTPKEPFADEQSETNALAGHDRGRIYRIYQEQAERSAHEPLSELDSTKLVALLEHANGWHREQATRLLLERKAIDILPDLQRVALTAEDPEVVVRVFSIMRSLGGVEWPTQHGLLYGLRHAHPQVRRVSLQLSEHLASKHRTLRSVIHQLAEMETNPHVQFQLALTVGQWHGAARNRALARILRNHSDQPWIRMAAFSSVKHGAGDIFALLAQSASYRTSEEGKQVLLLLATQIAKQQQTRDLVAIAKVLQGLMKADREFAVAIVNHLAPRPRSMAYRLINAATNRGARRQLEELIQDAQLTTLSITKTVDRRVDSTHILRLGKYSDVQDTLLKCISPSMPIQLQLAAINILAEFEQSEFVAQVSDRWTSFSPIMRQEASDLMLARQQWLPMVEHALSRGQLSIHALNPSRVALYANHPDRSVQKVARRIMEAKSFTGKDDIVAEFLTAVDAIDRGDPEQGANLFGNHCAKCHNIGSTKAAVGPDLFRAQSRDLLTIVEHTLDPHKQIAMEYTTYRIFTRANRRSVGRITGETDRSVTLLNTDGKQEVFLRSDIDRIQSDRRSLMPANFDERLTPQQMKDLLSFIQQEFDAIIARQKRADVSSKWLETQRR